VKGPVMKHVCTKYERCTFIGIGAMVNKLIDANADANEWVTAY